MKKILGEYNDVILLAIIAVPIGVVVGGIDAVFGRVLLWATDFRMEYIYWLIPFLGVAGAIIVWCYKKFGRQSAKGMSLIFEVGHGVHNDIPLRLVPLTIIGTWVTHLFGGSSGREGVAIQVGGAIAHRFGKRLRIEDKGEILLVTGMAAGFAGLFRTPIAATFFAIEVLTVGVLEHKAILPALTASYTASFISGLLGLEKFTIALTDSINFSWGLIPQLLLLGILFGVTGGLFSLSLHKTIVLFAKRLPNPILRISLVGIVISLFSLLCWSGRYSGLGTNLISMSFEGGTYPWDFAFKFIFTILTLSAGFQGGEVTPLFSVGATLGAILAALIGLPVAFVTALGYAAVFGSATNTLIAPMIIGVEIFGYSYLPYFFIVCTLAYICNGNLSIYPLQRRKYDNNENRQPQ